MRVSGSGAWTALVLASALPVAAQTPPGQTPSSRAGPSSTSESALTGLGTRPPVTPAGRDPTTTQYGLLPGRPRVTPTRTGTPPEIDGVLDDPVWLVAAHLTDFVQLSPVEGAPPTEATDVYIAYDSDHLYFAFHVHYADPSIMRANRVQRDRAASDDLMTIYLDTFLDQQQGYDLDVNGYGVQGDGIMSVGRGGGGGGRGGGPPIPPADRSWDALFYSAGRIVEDGYVAEMSVPFKSLRYPTPPDGEPHRWGFQIVREIKTKDEENLAWSPMSRDGSSFFSQMGLLEGMTGVSTSRNLEIMPTVTAIQHGEIDPTRPGFANANPDPDAGVNVKYGITSNLTADLTVNPDFSQIESDRSQLEVNLRFPISFPELRPFFLEGNEIFSIPAPVTFVHTRTIVDPDYGLKLSGKVGRVSFGLLTANDRAPGNVDDPDDPAFDQKAQTYIARAQVDLRPETNAGVIFTDREFLDGYSRLVGFDANFRITPTIVGDFRGVHSMHRRPGGAGETNGEMIGSRLVRSGRHVAFTFLAHQTSPEFRTDVGFVRRRDQRTLQGNGSYRFWPTASRIINWGPQVSYARIWGFDDVLQDETFSTGVNFSFIRSVSMNASFNRDMERVGGTEFRTSGLSFGGNVNAIDRISFGGNLGVSEAIYYSEQIVGDQMNWSVNSTIRPTDRVQTALNFSSTRLTDPARNDLELFDVKIARASTTVQFTDRLGLRNIVEYNSEDLTLQANLLFQYRVNAGTVFYLGYDDHYQQADRILGDQDGDGNDEQLFFEDSLRRTNRAVFFKAQYLIRY